MGCTITFKGDCRMQYLFGIIIAIGCAVCIAEEKKTLDAEIDALKQQEQATQEEKAASISYIARLTALMEHNNECLGEIENGKP